MTTPEIVCEKHLRGVCTSSACELLHTSSPYVWQVRSGEDWVELDQAQEHIEEAFCDPNITAFQFVTLIIFMSEQYECQINIDFSGQDEFMCFPSMIAYQKVNDTHTFSGSTSVRRLSTPSYVDFPADDPCFCTLWTWRWKQDNVWRLFGIDSPEPLQSILEKKYRKGQVMFQFYHYEGDKKREEVFKISFPQMRMDRDPQMCTWQLSRLPAFRSSADIQSGPTLIPESYALKEEVRYTCTFPQNWSPLDTQHDVELVPLDQDTMEFHLVLSEVTKTLMFKYIIENVYRIQNPFLWQKYASKRQQFEVKQRDPNECQLFHGTSDAEVVKCIYHQNFDWRMNGKNATIYGKGAYFAKDASYSDRYAGPEDSYSIRFVFMARVLVGECTMGSRDIVRPPPRDPNRPHAELYDSCVNNTQNPSIYVIFDSDQYYPEYLITYRKKPPTNPFARV